MNTIGIYIHIPFCDGKCYYCSFFSRCANETEYDRYTEKLIERIKESGVKYPRLVDTIYFGGGTPSVLGADRLCMILDVVKASFSVAEDAEITVEANPASAGMIDFAKLREVGFNRLSIGLQSSHDTELKALGRRHSADDAKETVLSAQRAGFDNISLDLMLAIPYQTDQSLADSVRFCADLGIQHISAYILKIEEGTVFYQKRESLPLFDDDRQAQLYELAVSTLAECGYRQYEISNFCQNGYESRHNLRYWHDEEYLGLGPSAHSFIDGKRFYCPDDMESFYKDVTEFESNGGDAEEYIMLALRLSEGLVFSRYEERFGESLSPMLLARAKQLERSGLVKLRENSISLTTKGMLVSNAVIGYLLKNP